MITFTHWNCEISKDDLEIFSGKLAELEKVCFREAWTKEMLLASLEQNYNHVFVALDGEILCGYLIASFVADETELLRVAVVPKMRKLGIGQQLLEMYHSFASEGYTRGLLEVRHGNVAAKHLYEKKGYQLIATRKNYYKNPTEDADIYFHHIRRM